jgi:hypothetical protein
VRVPGDNKARPSGGVTSRKHRAPKMILKYLPTPPSTAFEVMDLDARMHRIRVDAAFVEEVLIQVIFFRPGYDYPWVDAVWRFRPVRRALHNLVHEWMVSKGLVPERPASWIIHHINENKDDARSSNLIAMSRSLHARLHREMARRHSPRQRDPLGAWFKPRAVKAPSGHLRRHAVSTSQRARPRWQRGIPDDEVAAELGLAPHLDTLRARAAVLEDRTRKIPRSQRAHDQTLPRLGCRPGECAAVIAVILARREGEQDVEQRIARRYGIRVDLLHRILARPACRNALHNWLHFRRLPKPCPPTP